jgi:hypothetical protein
LRSERLGDPIPSVPIPPAVQSPRVTASWPSARPLSAAPDESSGAVHLVRPRRLLAADATARSAWVRPWDPARGSHRALVRREARTLTPCARRWPGGHRLPGAHVIRFGLSPLSSTFAGVLAGVGSIRALRLE